MLEKEKRQAIQQSSGEMDGPAAPPAVADPLLQQYGPPFDIMSDLLIGVALAPAGPLAEQFPGIPLLSIAGRAVLVIWVGCIRTIEYTDATGARRRMGSPDAPLYQELNVMALLRRPGIFVPALYATSTLSVRIAERYGMPKYLAGLEVEIAGQRFAAGSSQRPHCSVSARLIGSGAWPGWLSSFLWPRRFWPAYFPGGTAVRPHLLATPTIQPAYISRGRLALATPWLPEPVSLFPAGLYLAGQRMRLPPP